MDKRSLTSVLIGAACLLLVPLGYAGYSCSLPNAFDNTYYGEFSDMRHRLASSTRKKIVFIGTSGVAFGIYSRLLEEKLNQSGFDYDVINYGLYVAIGTKVMLDTSIEFIKEGDIVIFTPELNPQAMSTYFSPKETWRAFDSDRSAIWSMNEEDRKTLLASFPDYVHDKLDSINNGKNVASGAYGKGSFDENGDLINYPRDYNEMDFLYKEDEPVVFSGDYLSDGFLDYVNAYHDKVVASGASMYYYFSPMNEKAVDMSGYESYLARMKEKLHFRLLGNPLNSIYDPLYFYDSNVHLNYSGMICHTSNIYDDLRTLFGSGASDAIEWPAKPAIPEKEEDLSAYDNSDEDCFDYEIIDGKLVASSLSEVGKAKETIVVPGSHGGVKLTCLSAECLAEATCLRRIVFQSNITRIYDRTFYGLDKLESVVVESTSPSRVSIGFSLLDGCDNATIYVPDESLALYQGDYFWGHYAGRTKGVSTL